MTRKRPTRARPSEAAEPSLRSDLALMAGGVTYIESDYDERTGVAVRSTEQADPPARRPRDRGGAPARWDRPAFLHEIIRIADLDGIIDRVALTKHMQEWCNLTWGDEPSPSLMRQWISEVFAVLPPR